MSKSIDKKDEALKLAMEALEHGLVNTNPVLNYDGRIISKAITAIREALAEQPAHESAYQRGYMDGIAKGLRMEQPAQQEPVSWERFMSVEKELQDMTAEFMRVAKDLVALKAQQAQIPQVITCPFCESQHVPGWLHDYNMDRMKKPAQQGYMRCNTPKKCALYGCAPLTRPAEQSAPVEEPHKQQEPVVTRFPMKLTCTKCGAVDEGFLDVESETPPASKPWVCLTEQERNDLEDYCEMIIGKAAFDAIEAKLKEKNGF